MRYMKPNSRTGESCPYVHGVQRSDWGFLACRLPQSYLGSACSACRHHGHAHALQGRIVRATHAHLEHETRAQEIITAPNHSPADVTWPTYVVRADGLAGGRGAYYRVRTLDYYGRVNSTMGMSILAPRCQNGEERSAILSKRVLCLFRCGKTLPLQGRAVSVSSSKKQIEHLPL